MKHNTIYDKRKAQFYNELKLAIERSKISYTELSKNLPMYASKQAFGQAFKNRTLKLEALFAIADALHKRLMIRFLDAGEDLPASQTLHDPESDYSNTNQQLKDCRAQLVARDQMIHDLREGLKDKQLIIDILQQQLESKKMNNKI